MRRATISTTLLAGCVLALTSTVNAAELRVLASNGIKSAVEALQPQFEKTTGNKLSVDFSTAATLKERIEKGEAFDVAILTDDVVDALITSGKLSAAMRTELAAVGIGVGFREGSAKPDIRSAMALKQALLKVKSIAYTGNGATRPYIDKMFVTMGIAKEIEAKAHLTGPGQAPASVAKGESDIVITLISEILPEPGVQLAGPLPSDFQSYVGFSAAAGNSKTNGPAVQALVKFLDSPAAAATYKAKGMEAR
jgi:molybdate transport system substrate-binding protein